VQVGPHTYRIHLDKRHLLEGGERAAQCSPTRLVIAIDPDQPRTQQQDCVVHELVHAGLASMRIDEDLEEQVALTLAPQLLAVLRDNPKLVAWLTR